jgi:hypothetical protein
LKGDETLMVSLQEEIMKKPSNNQKCPCNSKYRYRKCSCFDSDKERTQAFIENKGLLKAEESTKFKSQLTGGLISV